METIHSILKLVSPGCWMVSVDLKDAYYCVKSHSNHQKCLNLKYHSNVYKYTAYPNGFASCSWKFTKLIKPFISKLHVEGHTIAGYLDDFILLYETYQGFATTVAESILHLDTLGIVLCPQKSALVPNHSLVFLGFVITSVRGLLHEKCHARTRSVLA